MKVDDEILAVARQKKREVQAARDEYRDARAEHRVAVATRDQALKALRANVDKAKALDPNHPFISEAEELLREIESRAAARPTDRDGSVVYFVQALGGGPIKVGTTVDVRKRIAELQTGSPLVLRVIATLPGGQDLEASIHRRLAAYRLHGEWFVDTVEVRAAMKGAAR